MKTRALGRCFAAASFVLAALNVAASPPASVAELREEPPRRTTRVIVEFDRTPQVSDLETLFDRLRADLMASVARKEGTTGPAPAIRHEYRLSIEGAAVEADRSTVERLKRLPYVTRVTPDVAVRVSPSTTVAADGPIDARSRVNAIPLGTLGAGTVVAVIDSGIDYRHPALGGGFGTGFKVIGGYDFVNDDADPIDDNGHGTHVAGIIAANGSAVLGVAPEANLLAYKVLSDTGNGAGSDIIAAIEMALDPNGDGDPSDRAHVMNLSLGGAGDAEDPLSRAVDAAVAAGVVMVVAAGNDGRTSSIGSPGTAADAVTVAAIDDTGAVTAFSSRGPSPRLHGFKPDVAAPGQEIASTWLDGAMVSVNGTSMAAPHVAGVAALLLKLHPDWDPAMVKEALTGGAAASSDHPFARGAGNVDADAAHRVQLVRDRSGLSFGLRPSNVGTSESSQTMRLTNRSKALQSLSIRAGNLPAGIELTLTPATVTIPAGEMREVSVSLRTDNAVLEFPEDLVIGGDLQISGSVSMRVPWGILRTTRAVVTYDGYIAMVSALDGEGGRPHNSLTPHSAEFFLPPGRTWDFMIHGYDVPENEGDPIEIRRTIVRENVAVTGDQVIDLRSSEASLEIVLDPRDRAGVPLLQRSGGEEPLHFVSIKVFREANETYFSSSVLAPKSLIRRTFYSPLSKRFSIYHSEHYFDRNTFEWYTVEHDLVTGLDSSKALSAGGGELSHAVVRWSRPPLRSNQLELCMFDALTTQIRTSVGSCFAVEPGGRRELDFHINDEKSTLSHSGFMIATGSILSQALRGRDGGIVISSETVPGLVAHRLASGDSYTVAAGAVFPFQFPGTATSIWHGFPTRGFYGSSGEIINSAGAMWTTYDHAGRETASGRLPAQLPPPPQAGSRLVTSHGELEQFGRFGSGTLDVAFGSNGSDLTAPTLTSLRVLDAAGHTVSTVSRGARVALQFSIADADFGRAGETSPSRPEMTRVWARGHGSVEWIPLPIVLQGSESGSLTTLKHFPAGDIYRADLSSLTVIGDRWIDVRIEFEDAAGNAVSWTNEMVVSVGDPSSPRRRATRR